MTTAVKDRQYPDLLFMHDVTDAVELEPMHRCPAHIRESDSSRFNASTDHTEKAIMCALDLCAGRTQRRLADY